MRSSAPDVYSYVMTELQSWVRNAGPENYEADDRPFGSGTEAALASFHKHLVRVVQDGAVVKALRDLFSDISSEHSLDQCVEAVKDIIKWAVTGYGLASRITQPGISNSQLLRDLETAEQGAKRLSRQLVRLAKHVPKAAFGVEHLTSRVPTKSNANPGAFFPGGWRTAYSPSQSDVQLSALIQVLARELSDHAARVGQMSATSGERQAQSKKRIQREHARTLVRIADQRLVLSSRTRLKPHHNFVHAVLCSLWGAKAVERSYISRLSSEMKTRTNIA